MGTSSAPATSQSVPTVIGERATRRTAATSDRPGRGGREEPLRPEGQHRDDEDHAGHGRVVPAPLEGPQLLPAAEEDPAHHRAPDAPEAADGERQEALERVA